MVRVALVSIPCARSGARAVVVALEALQGVITWLMVNESVCIKSSVPVFRKNLFSLAYHKFCSHPVLYIDGTTLFASTRLVAKNCSTLAYASISRTQRTVKA